MMTTTTLNALKLLASAVIVLGFLYELAHIVSTPVDLGGPDVRRDSPTKVKCDVTECDPSFLPDFHAMSRSEYDVLGPMSRRNVQEKFTVLMLTYDRFASFREAVNHYACMSAVSRLVLLWANQEVPAPSIGTFNSRCPEKIVVRSLTSQDITKRFALFPEIRTDGVLNIDDDMLFSEKDITQIFKIWKKYPWGIVGPFPRSHSGGLYGPSDLEYDPISVDYSLVLTSAAFLHREYLRMFDDRIPLGVRQEIDRRRNCEDLFMNFLVKRHCGCSGVFAVRNKRFQEPRHLMAFQALSGRSDHYTYRSHCLREFSKLFGSTVNLTKSYCLY